MRTVLETPVPRVLAWCSDATRTPVRSEYIIMELAEGIQLSEVWPNMETRKKVELVAALRDYQRRWLSITFHQYGSLYFARGPTSSSPAPDPLILEMNVEKPDVSGFSMGPTTSRRWFSDQRGQITTDRGPCKICTASVDKTKLTARRQGAPWKLVRWPWLSERRCVSDSSGSCPRGPNYCKGQDCTFPRVSTNAEQYRCS